MNKIAIVGMGYVGLANAMLLAERNEVQILEINQAKIKKFNNGVSPINDHLIQEILSKNKLYISATSSRKKAILKASTVVISLPTDFKKKINSFDTSLIEEFVEYLNIQKYNNLIVIRSTVPIGFTKNLQQKYPNLNIAFFPEFLREGTALHDSLEPSRIICGGASKEAINFLETLKDASNKKNVKTLVMSPCEAEATKLFSNAYLATRIAFFNELDTFALSHSMDSKHIIKGLGHDDRIGDFYNNPSFGYGGYCLPKDTKQLAANFNNIKSDLINAAISSNENRIKFLAKKIVNIGQEKIGIYKLVMKKDSDNWRESALVMLINELKKSNLNLRIYEPLIKQRKFNGIPVTANLKKFCCESDLIVANRVSEELEPYSNKIFSRDLFNIN